MINFMKVSDDHIYFIIFGNIDKLYYECFRSKSEYSNFRNLLINMKPYHIYFEGRMIQNLSSCFSFSDRYVTMERWGARFERNS